LCSVPTPRCGVLGTILEINLVVVKHNMKISTFTIDGKDVNLLFERGSIGYQFTYKEKPYGHKLKIKSSSKEEVANVTFLLLINYLETIKQLENEN
jgi:hypothetical protein